MKSITLVLLLSTLWASVTIAQDENRLLQRQEQRMVMHLGVLGNVGAINQLATPSLDNGYGLPDAYTGYDILHAPRPDFNAGLFFQLENPKSPLVLRYAISYALRALPKPTFNNSTASASATYQWLLLNGLQFQMALLLRSSDKVMVGLGIETTYFFPMATRNNADYLPYLESMSFYAGLRGLVVYALNPRTDFTIEVMAGNSLNGNALIDNVGGQVGLAYKLFGREKRIVEETYRVDYTQ